MGTSGGNEARPGLNFKNDFGIGKDQKGTEIWQWPDTAAPSIIDYLVLIACFPYTSMSREGGYLEMRGTARREVFSFTPGGKVPSQKGQARTHSRSLNVSVRHSQMQDALIRQLRGEYGREMVAVEHPTAWGTKMDALVKLEKDT